jgi:hypothetical protein
MAPTLELLEADPVPTGLARLVKSNRAFARWTARPTSAYSPRLGVEGIDQPCSGRDQAVGESQAAQLIVFVLAISGILLALEVGLRRAHRRP